LVRYADDFIIAGNSKELLEQEVKPCVEAFLAERGLELSQEKTKITHISEGFDFLGLNVRKYGVKLLIKPSAKNVKTFLEKVRETIRVNRSAKQETLIGLLNPMIRGWANYHRHVVAKKTYSTVDYHIWYALWRWARRRHPKRTNGFGGNTSGLLVIVTGCLLMTMAVQAADLMIYCVNWGFRLPAFGMNEPVRKEIADEFGPWLSELQYHGHVEREGRRYDSYGIVFVLNPYGEGRCRPKKRKGDKAYQATSCKAAQRQNLRELLCRAVYPNVLNRKPRKCLINNNPYPPSKFLLRIS
jgi:hypothetical protein